MVQSCTRCYPTITLGLQCAFVCICVGGGVGCDCRWFVVFRDRFGNGWSTPRSLLGWVDRWWRRLARMQHYWTIAPRWGWFETTMMFDLDKSWFYVCLVGLFDIVVGFLRFWMNCAPNDSTLDGLEEMTAPLRLRIRRWYEPYYDYLIWSMECLVFYESNWCCACLLPASI